MGSRGGAAISFEVYKILIVKITTTIKVNNLGINSQIKLIEEFLGKRIFIFKFRIQKTLDNNCVTHVFFKFFNYGKFRRMSTGSCSKLENLGYQHIFPLNLFLCHFF